MNFELTGTVSADLYVLRKISAEKCSFHLLLIDINVGRFTHEGNTV
jgi:hypothetical protein